MNRRPPAPSTSRIEEWVSPKDPKAPPLTAADLVEVDATMSDAALNAVVAHRGGTGVVRLGDRAFAVMCEGQRRELLDDVARLKEVDDGLSSVATPTASAVETTTI